MRRILLALAGVLFATVAFAADPIILPPGTYQACGPSNVTIIVGDCSTPMPSASATATPVMTASPTPVPTLSPTPVPTPRPTPLPGALPPYAGVYDLGSPNSNTFSAAVLANPNVDGLALRSTWDVLEPSDGVFNWTSLDAMIAVAKAHGKVVSISVVPGVRTPNWVYLAGAKAFSWKWDKSWSLAYCTTAQTPLPWDAVYLAKWGAFIDALGARYDGDPTVVSVKVTGVSSITAELVLPHGAAGIPINGGQCVSLDDTGNWIAAGYRPSKIVAAQTTITMDFALAFPSKHLATMFVPCGMPPIDESGNRTTNSCAQTPALLATIAQGSGVAQNNGLSATWIWPDLTALAAKGVNTAYQETGALGAAFPAAASLVSNGRGRYLEVYQSDLILSSNASAIADLHAALTEIPIPIPSVTPVPSKTPTPIPTSTPTKNPTATPTTTPVATRSPVATPSPVPSATPTPGGHALTHLIVVAEENNSPTVLASEPYMTSLKAGGAYASNYYAITHPSIGNYLGLTSGKIITNTDSITPATCGIPCNVPNIAADLDAKGISWKVYAEGLPAAGWVGGNSDGYSVRHNPFVYYPEIFGNASNATAHIVPFTQFATDVAAGTLPRFAFVVPNGQHNNHDGTPAQADAFVSTNFPMSFINSAQMANSALVFWWDEGTSGINGGGNVAFIVAGQAAKSGFVTTTQYSHYSFEHMMYDVLGMGTPPGFGATASGLATDILK